MAAPRRKIGACESCEKPDVVVRQRKRTAPWFCLTCDPVRHQLPPPDVRPASVFDTDRVPCGGGYRIVRK